MDEAIADIERALDAIEPVMTAVRAEDLDNPSPCHDWTAGKVVTHLLGGLNERAASANPELPRPDEATILADVPAAWRSTRTNLLTALEQPGAMDREVRGPGGRTMPLRMVVRILPVEVVLHGWDIARSAGMPTDFDPELAERLLATGRPLIEQFGRGTAFDAEQPAPAGASAADRLAAFYGRRLDG